MGITWAPSADKHGIDHEDALHAIEHAYYVERELMSRGRPRPSSPPCSSARLANSEAISLR